MKPPKVIWLQIGEDAETYEGFEGVTWCVDQINDTDIRYVLDEKDLKNRQEWEKAQEDFIR